MMIFAIIIFATLILTYFLLQELLNKFRDKKVDFAAHTNTEDGGAVFLNLLGECRAGLLILSCIEMNKTQSSLW